MYILGMKVSHAEKQNEEGKTEGLAVSHQLGLFTGAELFDLILYETAQFQTHYEVNILKRILKKI